MDHIVNLEFIGWAKSNTNCNVWGWEYQPFTQRWPGGGGAFQHVQQNTQNNQDTV